MLPDTAAAKPYVDTTQKISSMYGNCLPNLSSKRLPLQLKVELCMSLLKFNANI